VIPFICPVCHTLIQHPTPGDKLSCPGCGQRVQVPGRPPNKTVLGAPAATIDQLGAIPIFFCPKVFTPGDHCIEFDAWTATVVGVEKTVKTFVTGGDGGGYLNTDHQGRLYGSFYKAPIETRHSVEYNYWMRDDSGLEQRVYLPERLAAREGQSLTFLSASVCHS